jgi:hypothetical protein
MDVAEIMTATAMNKPNFYFQKPFFSALSSFWQDNSLIATDFPLLMGTNEYFCA